MKRILIILFIAFASMCSYAQTSNYTEQILYIIDGVPVIDDPDETTGEIKNEDIDVIKVVTAKEKIQNAGYKKVDKIIYITTKEYKQRSDEIKAIPTTKLMIKRNDIWYLKDSDKPYSGKFIDYYYNGKIQGDGELREGKITGLRTIYYQNGNKSFFRNYINGIANGYSEEYFLNGKLKQKGSFKDGLDDGMWQDFYSTGKLKRQITFINLKPQLTKEEKRFYDLQNEAITLMKGENHKAAIKKLNEAEQLNNEYADIYFYRGTAELEEFSFDKAVDDFDKAILLEPMYMEALTNRAFARIRKYEFKNSHVLNKNSTITILATKDKVIIPNEDKQKICSDLESSIDLGDRKAIITDAVKTYCDN